MAENALCKQLHKSFKALEHAVSVFVDTVNKARDVLVKLANLTEQYSSCNKANFELVGVEDFPDVRSRTLTKIQICMEDIMAQIWRDLAILESLSALVLKHRNSIDSLYRHHGGELDIGTMTKQHATQPSYAVMIEMISSIDDQVHFEYMKRWHSLKQVDYDDPNTVQSLKVTWEASSNLQSALKFTLGQVQFFMAENT